MSVKLAKELKIDHTHKYIPYETTFAINIKKAFKGEIIENQYPVDDYNIDFYFPKYKLAIEFDENRHRFCIKKDTERQKYIENKINCIFIRVQESDNIFDSINKIFTYIKNFK
jgi:very-short-patch-repair endonuclease